MRHHEGHHALRVAHQGGLHRVVAVGVKGQHDLADGTRRVPVQIQRGPRVVGVGHPGVDAGGGPAEAVADVAGVEGVDHRANRHRQVLPGGAARRRPELETVHADVLRRLLVAPVPQGQQAAESLLAQMGVDLRVGHQAIEEILILVHAEVEAGRDSLVGPGLQLDFPRAEGHVGREVADALAGAQFEAQRGRLVHVDHEVHLRRRAGLHRQHLRERALQLLQRPVIRQALEAVLAAGADARPPHEVLVILQAQAGDVLAGAHQVSLQPRHVPRLADVARQQAMFKAVRGGHADRLGRVGQGQHDARGAESHVRDAHDAAADEEIVDVARVERAVGDLVDALGVPLVAARPLAEDAVGRVQVDRPAAEGDGVRMLPLFDDVLLNHHRVALEAAAFALAGDVPHPLQRQVFSVRELARVLDVVPHAVDHAPQLPLDGLGLVHRVEAPAILDPPQAAAVGLRVEAAEARDFADVVEGVARRHEAHRPAQVLAVEIDGVAQQVTVLLAGRELFAEFVGGFGAHAEGRARLEGDHAVPRGIAEERRVQVIERRILAAEGLHAFDAVAAPLARDVGAGVQQQRDVGFVQHLLQQHGIEDERVALRVAVHVLDQNLVDDAALARPAVVVVHVRGGAQAPEPHFAGGVAAQHRPVLHQHDPRAGARRGQRGAGARQAAAHHHQADVEAFRLQFAYFRAEWLADHPRPEFGHGFLLCVSFSDRGGPSRRRAARTIR